MTDLVPRRRIGRTSLQVPPLGFGAFKIGRNQGIKYATPYDLPDQSEVQALLNGVLKLGCDYVDTAPAYGISEARIGETLGQRRDFVLSTKVGETFADGKSTYDFSRRAVEASLQRSCERLQRDVLDLVFIHSNGRDLQILKETDVVPVLQEWRKRGAIQAIGLSGKTPEGALAALDWADAIMVEYHLRDESHAAVMAEAADRGVSVIVKKGLASGELSAGEAIRFVLANPAVTALVVGGLNLNHFAENWRSAIASRSAPRGAQESPSS